MTRSSLTILNESNPSRVASEQQRVGMGSVLGRIRTAKVTVAANVAVLPEGAKALALLGGFRTAGTATGDITPVGNGATLAAGQAQVTASGDLAFFGIDAVTDAEVTYLAYEGEPVTRTLSISGSAASIGGRGAQVLAGATIGGVAQTVVARGTASPAAGQVALSLDGLSIATNPASGELVASYVPFPDQTSDEALRAQVSN